MKHFFFTFFQVSIEDDLRDSREVTFQAALLYTSSKGKRIDFTKKIFGRKRNKFFVFI